MLWACWASRWACLLAKSADCYSVRDRGVGGSNPLAPTNFSSEIPAFSLVRHSVYRVTGASNPASRDFSTRNRSRFAAVAVAPRADSSRQIATFDAAREQRLLGRQASN